MRLLQVSDPHFGTEVDAVVEALVRLAAELRPGVLVLSGDITQRARRDQFDTARAFVDRLGIARVVALPGNHDIPLFNPWLRAARPYANYSRAFGGPLETTLESNELWLRTVRTTRRWRHKHGQVSDAQIEAVAGALRRASPAQLRVVVVHQPMHVPRPEDEHNLLRNAGNAARAWAAAGADLVLGGHIHLPCVLPMSQRHAGLARELWCVQAGTAVSSRIRAEAPQSVNVVDFDTAREPGACTVVRWDYGAAADRFAPVRSHRIALQR
jgi:3',5'-cyclic AMP phosphodiesterase CpdA